MLISLSNDHSSIHYDILSPLQFIIRCLSVHLSIWANPSRP